MKTRPLSIAFLKVQFLFLLYYLIPHEGFSQNLQNETGKLQQEPGSYGFIENKGQIRDQNNSPNNDVKFLLLGSGINVQLKANSFSYDTYIVESKSKIDPLKNRFDKIEEKPDPIVYKFHRIDISLQNANPSPEIIKEEKSPDQIIYYNDNGNNPDGIAVNHYQRITYKEIYRGIDLVFDTRNSNNEKKFEYYFIVKQQGNIRDIKLKYLGAETGLEKNSIKIQLHNALLFENIPESYLVTSKDNITLPGIKNEAKIKVKYIDLGKNVYGFSASTYDRAKILVIDPLPNLVWGTYYGQTLNDRSYAIARDNEGSLFIGGSSDNSSNIATAGSYQSTFAGFSDAILGKFLTNGTRVWVTYYGGENAEDIFSIAIDAGNNILFTGRTFSEFGIATPGAHQQTKDIGFDCFIVKFTPAGTRVWGTYYGGDEVDYTHSIKVDGNGNIFIAGWTYSTNGIATSGSHQPIYAGGIGQDSGDGFLAKFDANGVRQWGTYYGGTSFDRFYDMDLDDVGNIYASGISASTSGIATTGSFQPSHGGGPTDAILVRFDNNGNRIWGTYFGGSGLDYSYTMKVDKQSNIVFAGLTGSVTGMSSPGSHQPIFGGDNIDGFVAKFNPGGNRIWSTYYGGNGGEEIKGINTDDNNNIYFTGWTYSTIGISTTGTYQPTGGGLNGIWTTLVIKLNSNGVRQWGTYYGYGGPYGEGIGEDIIIDNTGTVFVTGVTSFTNNISTCGAVQPVWNSAHDIFLAAFSEILTAAPAISIISDVNGPVCAGTTATFIATPINAGISYSYQWKVNAVNVGTNSSTYSSASLNNGDIITCVLSITPSACVPTGTTITSNSITVSIIAPVTPGITITASSTTICTGNTVTFNSSILNGGNSPFYQWKVNGINVGTNSPSYIGSSLNDSDIVSCILTSSFTCTTSPIANSNTIQITVIAAPVPGITIIESANNICPGDNITFTSITQNTPSATIYQWKLNGANIGPTSNSFSYNNFTNGDIITCTITGLVPGCTNSFDISSNSIAIGVKNAPVINIDPPDTTIFVGDSVQLTAILAGNITSYSWSPSIGLSNAFILNPIAKPLDNTTYYLTALEVSGCETTKAAKITVMEDIFLPKAFTPNNDGLNDLFRIPPGISFALTRFSVYDRWGNEVFKTTDISKGWDGKYKNSDLPIGVYVYIIKGRSSKGDVFIKGTVALVR